MIQSLVRSTATRSLRFRYLLGLSAIALLVTASFLTMQRVVSEQRDFARLVNLAGHQSGLVNRIAYFAGQLATLKDPAERDVARAQVGRTINKLEENHRLLRHGSVAEGIPQVMSETLRIIYEDPMVGLDDALARFLEHARTVYQTDMASPGPGLPAYILLTIYGPHVLEPILDAAVDEYERLGREAILTIERFEILVWLATLLTLVIELLVIFRPLERRIRQSITTLEQTVEVLEETRERLLAAQALALVGDWQWRADRGDLIWSQQTYAIFGVDPQQFQPSWQGFTALVHPQDRRLFLEELDAAKAGTEPRRFECRIRGGDGRERLVYQQIVARRNADGELLALAGAIQDISERRELSTRLEKLSQNIPGFIYQFELRADGSSYFPYASQGIVDLYGFWPEQVREDASAVFARIHPEDVERVANAVLASSRDLHIWRDQFRVQHPTHGEIWIEGHATPERLQDGATLWHGYLWDISDRKRADDQIRKLALFDPLTGLANRRLLRDRMEHALATAERNGRVGAVLMLDLDNFKTLNDTQGHDVGDALLVEVGRRLRDNVRAADTIARLGGDEFVAVLEALSRQDTEAREKVLTIAESIRRALNQPYHLEGQAHPYQTSVSIGITFFQGATRGVDDLLREADIGMFEAKEGGRNRICLFSEQRQATIASRTSLLQSLRLALQRDELRLFYQPQFSASGEIRGAEALLRWQTPDRGLVMPGEFILLAEESGLILPIGEWVLETACRHLRELEDGGLPDDFAIAVNISQRQFSDPGLLHKVKQAIERTGVSVRRLKLELTESSLFQDMEHAREVLVELHALGLGIELDDFGTGYSSLMCLKTLPLDTLKLDRMLTQGISGDIRDCAIIRAAIVMAKTLDLKVIAEGVETAEQQEFLVREGCDMLQGFLLALPMPYADLLLLLEQAFPVRQGSAPRRRGVSTGDGVAAQLGRQAVSPA